MALTSWDYNGFKLAFQGIIFALQYSLQVAFEGPNLNRRVHPGLLPFGQALHKKGPPSNPFSVSPTKLCANILDLWNKALFIVTVQKARSEMQGSVEPPLFCWFPRNSKHDSSSSLGTVGCMAVTVSNCFVCLRGCMCGSQRTVL